MTRTVRIFLLVVLVAVLSTAGALAFRGEAGTGTEDSATQGAVDNSEHVVDRLADAGITTDTDELDALADVYGVGGAVRVLAFADAAGVDPSEITAMRDDGMGWGEIARALAEEHPDFDLGPGIGWIMGHGNANGNGHGQGHSQAHGQGHDKSKPAGGDEAGD